MLQNPLCRTQVKTALPLRTAGCATALVKATGPAIKTVMPSQTPTPSAMSELFTGAAPAPDHPFVAVGDVHGRLDLLAPVLDRAQAAGLPVVMLGDYIDRGPDSAGVLRLLQDRSAAMDLTCLRGNHEDLMLRFLTRPRRTGRPWLRYGGRATLASFGINDLPAEVGPDDLMRAHQALLAVLGDQAVWMKSMPYLWQSGNVAACHAGADPHQPLDEQLQKAMTWGHPDFGVVPRRDGIWCVHGHRIVDALTVQGGVISVDTGAWKTGKLTAIVIGDGQIRPL